MSAISGIAPVQTKPTPLKKNSSKTKMDESAMDGVVTTHANSNAQEMKPVVDNAPTPSGSKQPDHQNIQYLAGQIKPTVIPVMTGPEKEMGTAPAADLSVGSIDQEGVLLKLLHKTLGSTNTEQQALNPEDDKKEKPEMEIESADTHPDNQSTSSDVLDLNESSSASVASVSASSSIISEMADPGNLTLSDGRLDKEKMSSLSFPTANISRSLEKSFLEMKQRCEKSQTHTSGTPIHSTPAPVTTVTRRRSSKRHDDQKAKTDALLLELGL